MQESTGDDLMGVCRGLVDALQGSLAWEWDDRFNGALAAYKADDKLRIQEVIGAHLNHVWESSNISNAPENITRASQHYGGLNAGQLLFTSDPGQDEFLLGLCWPWGNGQTISIRFIPDCANLSVQEATAKLTEFKTCFGL